jgi:ABC-type phosphate transport system substrate-binding protein
MSKKKVIMAVVALLLAAAPVDAQTAYKIIAHPDSPANGISRSDASRIFMKKTTRWSDGSKVVVVDLSPTSPVRASFTSDVIDKNVSAVQAYWQQQIFSGRGVPPEEMATDADVIAFVRSRPGAIGYVSVDAPVDGVKVLSVN